MYVPWWEKKGNGDKKKKQKPMLDGIVWENRKHLKRECKDEG